MNPTIAHRRAFRVALATLAALGSTQAPSFTSFSIAHAAPKTPAQRSVQSSTVGALTFDIAARVSATGKGAESAAQDVTAHVALAGSRARIESIMGGSRSVVLFTPPYVYKLLPDAKAGLRWKLDPASGSAFSSIGGFDPQQLLRQPGNIRAALLKSGAKRTTVTVLNGTPVEIYQVSRPGARFSQTKAWIRRADALPVRLEASGNGLKVVANWSNYARPKAFSASKFAPPKGFAIRETKNPPLMGLM